MQAFRVGDLPIESGMLTDALDNAQRKVEAYFFDIRKQLWEYDQVLLSAPLSWVPRTVMQCRSSSGIRHRLETKLRTSKGA